MEATKVYDETSRPRQNGQYRQTLFLQQVTEPLIWVNTEKYSIF